MEFVGSGGGTPDPVGSAPAFPGVMTRGIRDPATYYYRRAFTDAVRAVDAVRTLPFVDPARVSVTGGNQGGGIALAVAGLVPDLHAVMPDVPYLCHYRRAVDVASVPPFTELTRFLAVHRDAQTQVFTTLSYFDGVNFAKRATGPALFSVALMDDIVPPSRSTRSTATRVDSSSSGASRSPGCPGWTGQVRSHVDERAQRTPRTTSYGAPATMSRPRRDLGEHATWTPYLSK